MSSRLRFRAVLLAGAALLTVSCTDEIPTAVGGDFFLDGRPTTLQVELPASEFFEILARYGDFADPRAAGYGLVANDFQGRLDARTLARVGGFPEQVTYSVNDESITDTVFSYAGGTFVAPVDINRSTSDGTMTLELWSLAQSWDRGTVTWETAVDTAGERTAWQDAGGTLGRRLATTEWATEGDAFSDTLAWALDSLALQEMAEEDFPGVVIVPRGESGRMQVGTLGLNLEIIPETTPDTVLTRAATVSSRVFVFTPEWEATPPREQAAGDALSIGGVRGNRAYFRMNVPAVVPGCPPGVGCPDVPLTDVALNRVTLLLERAPVADGFGGVGRQGLQVYELAEPELGRQAPLGGVVLDGDDPNIVPDSRQQPLLRFSAGDPLVRVPITGIFRELVEDGERIADFALIGGPDLNTFGAARFATEPRLRITYSLRPDATLP